jgi:hypothetical protein
MLVAVIAVITLACGRPPVSFALPPQQSLDLGPDPGGLGPFVTMDDPASDDYIVRDISPDRDHHRWAFLHPELRFRVKDVRNLKFAADFAIPEVTYRVTGPVTIAVAVTGQELGRIRCDHPGDYHWTKAVPAGMLADGGEVHVTFHAAPRWVSPEDGAQLSFYLRSAGFVPE